MSLQRSESGGRGSNISSPMAPMTVPVSWMPSPIAIALSRSSAGPTRSPVQNPARTRVVERTFGWMTRRKRLVRDYVQRIDVSEAMIHVAMGSLMLRRIAPP